MGTNKLRPCWGLLVRRKGHPAVIRLLPRPSNACLLSHPARPLFGWPGPALTAVRLFPTKGLCKNTLSTSVDGTTSQCVEVRRSVTLAVSSSCSSSSRLEGFKEVVTQVKWPKNWGEKGRVKTRASGEQPRRISKKARRPRLALTRLQPGRQALSSANVQRRAAPHPHPWACHCHNSSIGPAAAGHFCGCERDSVFCVRCGVLLWHGKRRERGKILSGCAPHLKKKRTGGNGELLAVPNSASFTLELPFRVQSPPGVRPAGFAQCQGHLKVHWGHSRSPGARLHAGIREA